MKGLETLYQERIGLANTLAIVQFNIPFHKSEPANKQHTNQSFDQSRDSHEHVCHLL